MAVLRLDYYVEFSAVNAVVFYGVYTFQAPIKQP
jgi:hypothetical protein